MKKYGLIFYLLLHCYFAKAQCTMAEYQNLMGEARASLREGKYSLALNKLFSARACQPEREAEVNKRITEVFDSVNVQRIRAENATVNAQIQRSIAEQQRDLAMEKSKRVISNSLLFNVQQKKPDRSTAFWLVNFALKLDPENPAIAGEMARTVFDRPKFWNRTFTGHDAAINLCAYSPDGKWLVSTAEDGSVTLWDLQKHRQHYTFFANPDNVSCYFRTITQDPEYHYEFLSNFEIISLAFSPDGTVIAAGSLNGKLLVWPTGSPEKRRYFEDVHQMNQSINHLAFSSDSKRLITADNLGNIATWDMSTGFGRFLKPQPSFEVHSLDYWDKDGRKILATLSKKNPIQPEDLEKEVFLLDANTGEITDSFNLKFQTPELSTLVFKKFRNILAIALENDKILIYNASKKVVWDTLHSRELLGLQLVNMDFSYDGGYLLTTYRDITSQNKNIVIWDVGAKQIYQILNGHSGGINFGACSTQSYDFATVADDHSILIWHFEAEKPVFQITLSEEHIIPELLRMGDGKRFVGIVETLSGSDRRIRMWDAYNNKILFEAAPHESKINAIALSKNEKYLLSGSGIGDNSTREDLGDFNVVLSLFKEMLGQKWDDFSVSIYDLETARQIFRFDQNEAQVDAVAFAPDNQHFAWCGREQIYVGDLQSTDSSGFIWKVDRGATALTFNDDGRLLISATESGLIVWDYEKNTVTREINTNLGMIVLHIRVLPDGLHILTLSSDGLITKINIETQETVFRFGLPVIFKPSLEVSPEGDYFAIKALDDRIWIYRISDGEPVLDFNSIGSADIIHFIGGPKMEVGIFSNGYYFLRSLSPDSLIAEQIRNIHPNTLSFRQIEKYRLEEAFSFFEPNLLGFGNPEADEQWAFSIADYYLSKARQTPSGEKAQSYFLKAKTIFQQLKTNARIYQPDTFERRLQSINLGMK